MALNSATLKSSIVSTLQPKILTAFMDPLGKKWEDVVVDLTDAIADAVASEVINHFKTYAEVSTTTSTSAAPLFVPPNAVAPQDGGLTLQTNIAARAGTPLTGTGTGSPGTAIK